MKFKLKIVCVFLIYFFIALVSQHVLHTTQSGHEVSFPFPTVKEVDTAHKAKRPQVKTESNGCVYL